VYDVYSCYNKNKGKGWGVIAKEMGIKPGSDQFKRLKSQMSQKESYWKNTFNDYGKKKNPKVAYKKRTALKSDLYRDFDKKSKEMKGNDKAKGKKENKGNKNKNKHANNGR
jgi:transketolase